MREVIADMDVRDSWISIIQHLQEQICGALEAVDGQGRFVEDAWQHPEGGGGRTRVLSGGAVIEKGGVNSSAVHGEVTEAMRDQLKLDGTRWFACGLSIVIHPLNPFVPSVHSNCRMVELYDEHQRVTDRWFGGGTDLTPYYVFAEDARLFHLAHKNLCDAFDPAFHPLFKKNCDDYFVNWHRDGERRGIGGIFYDYQRPTEAKNLDFWMNFGKACGETFLDAYVAIVEKRKNLGFTERHKQWQEIRRGRYVEFNLLHDRGTLFGLKTNGRTESILMSLPPTVRFEYDHQPVPGSEEDRLLQICLHPRDWLATASVEGEPK